MSNSLRSHGLQHARLPCPWLSPRVLSNSCPLSWWYHLILCCPFLLLPQSFPASGSFPMSWKSIGASALVLPMNVQGWFPGGLTGLISLLSKGLSRSSARQFKSINSLVLNLLVQLSHPYMTTGKIIALTIWTFVSKVIALLFNKLSGFVIVPLGSKCFTTY